MLNGYIKLHLFHQLIMTDLRSCHVFVVVQESRDPIPQMGEYLHRFRGQLVKKCGKKFMLK